MKREIAEARIKSKLDKLFHDNGMVVSVVFYNAATRMFTDAIMDAYERGKKDLVNGAAGPGEARRGQAGRGETRQGGARQGNLT